MDGKGVQGSAHEILVVRFEMQTADFDLSRDRISICIDTAAEKRRVGMITEIYTTSM